MEYRSLTLDDRAAWARLLATLAGTDIADHLAGLYGAIGTLLALRARDRTGEGQLVDVASLDSLVSSLVLGRARWRSRSWV